MVKSQHDNERLVKELFNNLVAESPGSYDVEKKSLIDSAFKLAYDAHKGDFRKSGEPYIIHPIAVATIVCKEIGLGTKSIVASLLHDVVEDTPVTVDDLDKIFGNKISAMVDGLTKLADVFEQDKSIQAENFKRLLLTLTEDIRVILIKIADRLHNMRTLDSMPYRKQLKISAETLYLFAPIAQRLGLFEIKTELEDLSFKFRHPDIYKDISENLEKALNNQKNQIESFVSSIEDQLHREGFEYKVKYVLRSVYSIWKRMQDLNLKFEDIHDFYTVLIVVNNSSESLSDKHICWNVYSKITDIYNPRPERIRDWISNPKANGYKGLHLTVMSPEGKWVEVQIRTRDMHEIAEKGFAAYWKKQGRKGQEKVVNSWLVQIKEQLDNNKEALEFVEEFKYSLFSSEIVVFTHKGDIKKLPKNSSVLDFAYDIHTQIGDRCIGAKINHKSFPRNHILHSGDQVEIITSETQRPEPEWQDLVVTAKAKSRINDALKRQRKEYLSVGKSLFEEVVISTKSNIQTKEIKEILQHFKVFKIDDLYFSIGVGRIKEDELIRTVKRKSPGTLMRYWQISFGSSPKPIKEEQIGDKDSTIVRDKKQPFYIREEDNLKNLTFATCCNPIPGDDVIGFYNEGKPIVIHKKDCLEASKMMTNFGDSLIETRWSEHKRSSFSAKIELKGVDSMGLVSKVTKVISEKLSVNIQSIRFNSNQGIFDGEVTIFVQNTTDLNNLIFDIVKIKGIESVQRIV